MRQDSVNRGKAVRSARDALPADDVRFDLPPVFGGDDDRRMAQRAEAQWRLARAPHATMPGHHDMATGAAGAFAEHALLLDLRRGDRVDVLFAGAAVTAAFGITPGYLASSCDGGLAALLLDSCELMRLWRAVVPVDAALAGSTSACLLTRGVLLPLADDAGGLGYVHGVLNWKQLLDRAASESLRREVNFALRGDSRHLSAIPESVREN
ncbi:hypothetical protein EUV02_08005 [Polymorphobacter arshaanensis]|uniref:Uncharacterized protein n=1 Tax=Glacieibacterium arshaanense TaxID=2511025 RepID=A0A4Y9EP49_9SPHN|nr:hypothetical protein [Polymorphobacter arshaanensis]TFU03129.1 hypothetical protein EUV02_08005 [Polymorphobacter arshaanensis]